MHAYGEFQPLQDLIQGMPVGPRVILTSDNDHVPEIERIISVVKERIRDMRHSPPFHMIPQLMIIHAVINIGKTLN